MDIYVRGTVSCATLITANKVSTVSTFTEAKQIGEKGY